MDNSSSANLTTNSSEEAVASGDDRLADLDTDEVLSPMMNASGEGGGGEGEGGGGEGGEGEEGEGGREGEGIGEESGMGMVDQPLNGTEVMDNGTEPGRGGVEEGGGVKGGGGREESSDCDSGTKVESS